MKTIQVKVNLVELMLQAARECRSSTIAMGFSMGQSSLIKIANRAIEIKDDIIMQELKNLMIITEKEN